MKAVAVLAVCVAAVWSAPPPQQQQQQQFNQAAVQPEQQWPIIPYEFAYEVADPETNNYHNRVEIKLPNGDVMGSWSYLRPDNMIQTIVYNVTGNEGFRYTISLVPYQPDPQQQQGQVNQAQQSTGNVV